MVKLRGSLFTTLRGYVQHNHPEAYRKIINGLNPTDRELFESVISLKEYFDLLSYQAFLSLLQEQVDHQEFCNSAKYMADRDLKGIFLIFARMLSKEFLIKRMASFWDKLYTAGSISLIESKPEKVGVKISGVHFNEAHRLHSELYCKTILELADKKTYRSESKSVSYAQTELWFYPES